MADRSASKPPAPKGRTREDRLKAALKANMARRKAQARARRAQTDGEAHKAQAETEGEGPEERGNEHG